MNLPINNTNNILVSAPGSVPTPSAGTVTYFFNTEASNNLYYKDDAGNVVFADQSPEGMDECVCSLLCQTNKIWGDGLLSGTLTSTEYSALIEGGFQVVTPSGTFSIGTVNNG